MHINTPKIKVSPSEYSRQGNTHTHMHAHTKKKCTLYSVPCVSGTILKYKSYIILSYLEKYPFEKICHIYCFISVSTLQTAVKNDYLTENILRCYIMYPSLDLTSIKCMKEILP